MCAASPGRSKGSAALARMAGRSDPMSSRRTRRSERRHVPAGSPSLPGRGARGYDDNLIRGNRENLGRGIRPHIASLVDLTRMLEGSTLGEAANACSGSAASWSSSDNTPVTAEPASNADQAVGLTAARTATTSLHSQRDTDAS